MLVILLLFGIDIILSLNYDHVVNVLVTLIKLYRRR